MNQVIVAVVRQANAHKVKVSLIDFEAGPATDIASGNIKMKYRVKIKWLLHIEILQFRILIRRSLRGLRRVTLGTGPQVVLVFRERYFGAPPAVSGSYRKQSDTNNRGVTSNTI